MLTQCPKARGVHVANDREPFFIRDCTNDRRIEVVTIEQVGTLTSNENLHPFTRLGQRIEQHPSRGRMQYSLWLLDTNQRDPAVEHPRLEERGKDADCSDGPVRHRLRAEGQLLVVVPLMHLNSDVAARMEPVDAFDPGSNGGEICVEALLDRWVFRIERAQHIAQMRSSVTEGGAFDLRLR